MTERVFFYAFDRRRLGRLMATGSGVIRTTTFPGAVGFLPEVIALASQETPGFDAALGDELVITSLSLLHEERGA